MKKWMSSLVFVIACGGSSAKPGPSAAAAGASTAAPTEAEQAGLETSPRTSCTRDDACHCRVFTGAAFEAGKVPSRCCTEAAGCTDAMGGKVEAGHCMLCVYD